MDVRNLVQAVSELLSRFACVAYAEQGATKGVWVQRNDSGKFLFVFTTEDKITVKVVFEAEKATREYISNMVGGIISKLNDKRAQRQKDNVITLATDAQIAIVKGTKL